jgi:hypothetical protein
MGMHGIAEVDAGVHTEYEVQDFKRFKATGMFDTMGFNRVEYQPSSGVTASTTTTTTSFDNFSSAVTWFYQQNAYFNIASGQTY